MATDANPLLPSVLVIGGCGFLGYHLVKRLLADPEIGSVTVVDRAIIAGNTHPGAAYVQADIADAAGLRAALDRARPVVVFHMASPPAALPHHLAPQFALTNVEGTRLILDLAAASPDVRALVYSSTIDTYAAPPHFAVDETHPLVPPTDFSSEYNRTKAMGDTLVRAANDPASLRTACIRIGHAYGERSSQGLYEPLDMCAGGGPLFQVGRGDNIVEVASADNIALGHVLAAKALVDPSRANGKVDGEAFNISDGAPVPFWHHIKVIWSAARGKDVSGDVYVIPAWVMGFVVHLAAWVLYIGTLNTVKPPMALGQTSFDYCTKTHTYSIEKAVKRLGFRPSSDHDKVLADSVHWLLNERAALAGKKP